MKFFKTTCIIIFILTAFVSTPFVSITHADDLETASYFLFRLINEARLNPLKTLARIGIQESTARAALGDDAWVLDLEQGLPPLSWNEQLESSATTHNNDMVGRVYYGYVSPNGSTVLDRTRRAGYESDRVSESLGYLAFEAYLEPMEAANLMFINMLRYELDPGSSFPKNIFNYDYDNVGISLSATVFSRGEDLPINVYLSVADFGKNIVQTPMIIGNAYFPPDTPSSMNNVVLAPQDIYAKITVNYDVQIFLRNPIDKSEYEIPRLPHGVFQFEATPGFYFLLAKDPDGNVVATRNFYGYNLNQVVNLWVGWTLPDSPEPTSESSGGVILQDLDRN